MDISVRRSGGCWFLGKAGILATVIAMVPSMAAASCAPPPELVGAMGYSAQANTNRTVADKSGDLSPHDVPNYGGVGGSDADTALSLAAEGAVLYSREAEKKDGYEYCGQAVQLAEKGEFRESARAASKALHVALQTGNKDLLGKAYRDLAIAFNYAGQLERAEQFAELALRYPGVEPDQVIGPSNKVLGDVRTRQHQYVEAIRYYELARSNSPSTFRPLVDASLANALILSGDLVRARSTLGALAEPADSAQKAQLQRTRGRLLLAENKPAEALALYQQLANAPVGGDEGFYRAWALDGISKSEAALGRDAEAAQALDQAIDVFDQARSQFRSDEFKMGLFSDLQSVFERAIGMHSKLGQPALAFDISERSRSRALLDAVAGRAELQGETGKAMDAVTLQKMLQPDEVVVAYHALPDRLMAWVLSNEGVREVPLPEAVTRPQLESLVSTYRYLLFSKRDYFDDVVPIDAKLKTAVDALTPPLGPAYRTVPQHFAVKELIDRQADALGKLLLKPLGVEVGKRLVIVPHGPLHFLPFQSLRVDGQYLIERNPVSIAPSTSIALSLARTSPLVSPAVLVMGNPQPLPPNWLELENTETEARNIAGDFGGSTLLLRGDASKSSFKSALADKQIVHLATHGKVDRLDPLHSALLFAGIDEQTSYLEAKEAMGLDFQKAALIVLSACETGLGSVRQDDEVLGFTRTFLGRGAGALVSTFWEVDDYATKVLMTRFYEELAAGKSAQDAMRSAQLALLGNTQFRQLASPQYWAPFNLIGNWRLKVAK